MNFVIKKGRHGDRPFRLGLFFGREVFRWKVIFTDSCKYNHHSADQLDTNKLVGIGYLPGHHTDSVRFGWRYVTDINRIELVAYCFVNKIRIIKPLCLCEIGKEYEIAIFISPFSYFLSCMPGNRIGKVEEVKIDHKNKKRFQYRLGCFFGGNIPAPHDITIKLKRA